MVGTSTNIGNIITFIFLFVISTLTSCGNKYYHSLGANEYSRILQLILDHEDLRLYFHQELAERTRVTVVTNGYIPLVLDVKKFGRAVEFTNSPSDRPKFEVSMFVVKSNHVHFSLTYDIEGVQISGEATKAGGSWELSEVEVWEG